MTMKQALEKLRKHDNDSRWYLIRERCYRPKEMKSGCLATNHKPDCSSDKSFYEIGVVLPGNYPVPIMETQADNWEEAVMKILSRPKPKIHKS